MKKNISLCMLLFVTNVCMSQGIGGLFVDCGEPLVYCSNSYSYDHRMNIGDGVVVENGVEPYTYEWSVKGQYSKMMFDDSRSINPKIVSAPHEASIHTLYLTVSDASGQTATDSLIVYFSGNNEDRFLSGLTVGMDLGDSLCLNNSLFCVDTLFSAKTFLISAADTLQMPTTIKPVASGTYSYYTVDSLGCVSLTKHFEVNLNDDAPENYEYFPLVRKDAEWCQLYYFGESIENGARCRLEHFKMSDDTVINGMTYSKLYYYSSESFTGSYDNCIGGIRETDKQVFFVPFFSAINFPKWNYMVIDTLESLIYDFNAGSVVANSAVESVAYKKFGTEIRKVYNTKLKTIVEGIGCLQGFLDAYTEIETGYTYSELVYYKFDDKLIFLNNYTTESPSCGLDDILSQHIDEPIILYSNNSLRINCEITTLQVLVIDIQGRTQLQETVSAGESVDCQCLPAGVYLVVVQDAEGRVLDVDRIVKQ